MTNALIAEREIPGSLILWNYYLSRTIHFKLSENNSQVGINNGNSNSRGNIKVERASARFDFRDASPLKKFEYNVIYLDADKKRFRWSTSFLEKWHLSISIKILLPSSYSRCSNQ